MCCQDQKWGLNLPSKHQKDAKPERSLCEETRHVRTGERGGCWVGSGVAVGSGASSGEQKLFRFEPKACHRATRWAVG
eukprot:9441931-Prorocentrum_lima.AAC.1